jgi:hypothetical protein
MRTTRSLALAALAALAVTTAPLAPAHAAAGPPATTSPCSVVTVDGSAASGEEVAVFSGRVAAPGAAAVSVRCSLHADNDTHDGPAVAEATGGPTPHAAAIPVAVTTHPYDETAVEYLCGEATVDGTTWYWTGLGWSTAAGSGCGVLVNLSDCLAYGSCGQWEYVPWDDVPWDSVPPALQPAVAFVRCEAFAFDRVGCPDAAVCPYLAALAPGEPGVVDIRPDGDLYVAGQSIWDCPPYNPVE